MDTDRFTEDARAAMAGSADLMRARRHAALDVEHLLLAVLRQAAGPAERILRRLSADVARAAVMVERELEHQPTLEGDEHAGDQVVSTARLQRVLERAREQAEQLGEPRIGTDHLLLAISGEPGGAAGRTLAQLDVTEERVALAVVDLRHPLLATSAPVPRAPSLEDRVAALEVAVAELRLLRPTLADGEDPARAELEQARLRIATLERQNRYLEELLRITQDNLAYTRGLLEQSMRRAGAP